jgi:hypothetical protein
MLPKFATKAGPFCAHKVLATRAHLCGSWNTASRPSAHSINLKGCITMIKFFAPVVAAAGEADKLFLS